MARIRSVKPEFCTSEAIAALPRDLRLHFIQLWTYADDYGRGKDEPRVIKGAIWPIDDDVTAEQVEEWQNALALAGRIVRYVVDGKRFFEVVNWCEHQKPNRRTDSRLPAPDQGEPLPAVQEQCIDTALAVQAHRDCPAVVVGGEVEGGVEVEVDPAGSASGQPPLVAASADPDAAAADREQAIRRSASLIGRTEAAERGKGSGYAATVTSRILTDPDRTDRDRIRQALDAGESPEAIAEGWLAAALYPVADRPAEPVRPSLVRPSCDECGGAGLVMPLDATVATRCPECNPDPLGAAGRAS